MANFTLSPAQLRQLDRQGFTRLPGAVPPELLDRLRDTADRLEARALDEHARACNSGTAAVFDAPGGPVVERVNRLLEWCPEEVIDLLSSPPMMAIAREICGADAVPVETDLLYKRPHPNGYVIWHQDARHAERCPYLNVGIYLDDAEIDDGCLRYVPGTHHELADICALAGEHGWDIPGAIDVPAQAGDILVQHVMVLHASRPKRRPNVRRTIYAGFRPAASISAAKAQSEAWIEARRRWMALITARADAADWPAAWRAALPEGGTVAQEVAAVAALQEPPQPAHHCHKPIDHPDYPVPADLRDGGRTAEM
ncbi:phytanoyl-CoA dioxygenase family protein [Marinovum sp.]|uniref:phytanoyl-CoA dioxygenase family protein n=1 Tax=Marinovum sp. TaxID=2024839 RepID=UPI002B27050F|nr:phytanoyl-CoA dioxygenase family protein [Marinovum sp.]